MLRAAHGQFIAVPRLVGDDRQTVDNRYRGRHKPSVIDRPNS
jgi:hypothetical protein